SQPLVTLNEHLAGVAPGQIEPPTYTGEDGQPLKAWLLLPPDYQPGKRYPLVTEIYAGDVMSDTCPKDFRLNQRSFGYNLQLFAAQGYAVLLPSMPLPPRGEATDVYLELAKGVMPAVDRAILSGVADPQRLAVSGASFGGFSVYGLITQT